MVCLLMLVYAGMEIGLASWIPTYAIKAGVATTEESTFYSQLYWVPSCIGRLAWIYAPGGMATRIAVIMKLMVGVGTVSLLLQTLGQYEAVCLFSPVASGLLLSNVYLFYLSLAVDHGFEASSNSTAHIMLANALGEGVINMPTGYLIRNFSFQVLMVLQVLFAVLSSWTMSQLHTRLDREL